MEIFTFDKSLQERMIEFTEIFSSSDDKIVPSSRIKAEWSFHVELVIEPAGWRALWKIPRLTCQDFGIHYPTIVVVEVECVIYSELSALVKIIAVQDDIHLPSKYEVPLEQLYPTLEQENKVLDVWGTANCIEQLRFFYQNLWMPWDRDDDDNADWTLRHLEPRLRLFFDVKRGLTSKETSDFVRSLAREGKDLQMRIERIEADMSEDEDDNWIISTDGKNSTDEKFSTVGKNLTDGHFSTDEKFSIGGKMSTDVKIDTDGKFSNDRKISNDGKTCELMKLHLRMQQIKGEMEVMENPEMREVITRNKGKNGQSKRRESRGRKTEGYFVWHGGSLDETLECLKRAKDFVSGKVFLKVTGCLQEALSTSEVGDIIIIGDGEHHIRGSGGLEEGGTLRGIGNLETTVICPTENASGTSLFDFSGGEILLENLLLDLGELQAGLLVRSGTLRISNCKIFVASKSVIKLGIVVLSSGKLIAENTIFSGLGTAVTIHPAGEAIINECKFENCIEGVQLNDQARFSATKSSFSGFSEFGIRMVTDKYFSENDAKTGGIELLSHINEITISDCIFENNYRGDVTLRPRLTSALTTKPESAIAMIIS